MSENEMGYRGSKSKLNQVVQGDFVKEQRVDGSWSNKAMTNKLLLLRYTLMGFEKNYQVNVLSKQLNRSFSFSSKLDKGYNLLLCCPAYLPPTPNPLAQP